MVVDQALFEMKVDRSGPHHVWTGSRSERGVGQLRVAGKLYTATKIAWQLAYGDLPKGVRILSCPDEPACVNVEHLRRDDSQKSAEAPQRVLRGSGTIREMPGGAWKIGVSAGRDDSGYRRRVFRTVHGNKTEALRQLAELRLEIGDGSQLPDRDTKSMTVDELVVWYLVFARDDRGLEHSTLFGYADVYDHWLQKSLGHLAARSVKLADIDKAFGRMRRGGMSHSRMNNGRALLSGAFKWGKRHGKVHTNPIDGFEIPRNTHRATPTNTPELEDLLRLLDGADEHDTIIAPVLKLGATTGMRRGELSGLRRDRLRLDHGELVVDTAINDAGGIVVEKPTKTQQSRTVSIDAATVTMLRAHLAAMEQLAQQFGTTVAEDGFVFSLEPACDVPMRPEFMTRRVRALRTKLGIKPGDFDATILALRKWTSSELLDSGFNPTAVSDRQGHTVQVMLSHYSSRRKSADRAAADHLGARVHGTNAKSL